MQTNEKKTIKKNGRGKFVPETGIPTLGKMSSLRIKYKNHVISISKTAIRKKN